MQTDDPQHDPSWFVDKPTAERFAGKVLRFRAPVRALRILQSPEATPPTLY